MRGNYYRLSLIPIFFENYVIYGFCILAVGGKQTECFGGENMRFFAILLTIFMLSLFIGCKGKDNDADTKSKANGSGQSQSDELPVENRDDAGWSQDVI